MKCSSNTLILFLKEEYFPPFLGRISALELQIARAEGARRDVEFKLTAIHSHMRRTLGIGREAGSLGSPERKQPQDVIGKSLHSGLTRYQTDAIIL